jgi:hypothetical protein
MILALDPGTTQTAWVLWSGSVIERVAGHGITANEELLDTIVVTAVYSGASVLAVEMIASYGMPVGREVFETCVWIGRFIQAWSPRPHRLVYRRDVKLELCGSARAKDPNVRQALLDRVGAQGTKKAPGPTYGLKADEWAALGVAVTAAKLLERKEAA